MMKILVSGLERIQPDCKRVKYDSNHATIPLSTKREFLQSVAKHYGLGTVLQLGRGVDSLLDDPLFDVLVCSSTLSTSVEAMFSKWQRLERYVHANHFIDVEHEKDSVNIRHLSRTSEPPSLREDLAVLGLLCALVFCCGARDVCLVSRESEPKPIYQYDQNQVFTDNIAHSKTWQISWQAPNSDAPIQLPNSQDASRWQQKVQLAIQRLGLIECTLPLVAQYLGVSTRSLQRHLSAEQLKFAQILQESRVNHAAKLIVSQSSCLAQIGFMCGFSDQAHFTRVFSQWNGMSPKAYLTLCQ